jgi:hypothetical protein
VSVIDLFPVAIIISSIGTLTFFGLPLFFDVTIIGSGVSKMLSW